MKVDNLFIYNKKKKSMILNVIYAYTHKTTRPILYQRIKNLASKKKNNRMVKIMIFKSDIWDEESFCQFFIN